MLNPVSFRGKISRRQYWFLAVVLFALGVLAATIREIIEEFRYIEPGTATGQLAILASAYAVVVVIVLLVFFSATIRRLRDAGGSAWWSLSYLVPLSVQVAFLWVCQGGCYDLNVLVSSVLYLLILATFILIGVLSPAEQLPQEIEDPSSESSECQST